MSEHQIKGYWDKMTPLSAEERERLAGLERNYNNVNLRLQAVEAYAANFVTFQQEMRAHKDEVHDFVTDFKATAKSSERREAELAVELDKKDKRRSRIHFWLLGLLSSLIVAMFVFLLNAIGSHHVSEVIPHSTSQSVPQSAENSPAYTDNAVR